MKQSLYPLLVLTLFLNLLPARPLMADLCLCAETTLPTTAFDDAEAVFTGTVTKVVTMPAFLYDPWIRSRQFQKLFPPPFGEQRTSFTVNKSWKGITTTQVTVFTFLEQGRCGHSIEEGKEFLVYAERDGNNWWTNYCRRTSPTAYSNTADDFTFLATQPTLPLTTPFPWSTAFCGLALFALVAIFGIGWRTWRKRKKEPTPAA